VWWSIGIGRVRIGGPFRVPRKPRRRVEPKTYYHHEGCHRDHLSVELLQACDRRRFRKEKREGR
jgi:hypothetical protein